VRVTLGTPRSFARLRLVSVVATAALVFGGGLVAAPAAFAAEGPCVGDTCDEGAWLAARGEFNDGSYWGMSAGHNCTNYVAWRLISAGVEKPATQPGNAADWAANAVIDGYAVDDSPSVGSVAQWDSLAGGYGLKGHVAYVEQVNDDGTILVSEDYWRDGQQLGPLTYRIVVAASVSHYIHYLDDADWLRTASLSAGSWLPSRTGLDIEPTAMAAVALEGSGEVFYAVDGKLWQVTRGANRWVVSDTGVGSQASSISAVTMDGTRPYVMSIDKGVLFMTVRTVSGWQRMSTGFAITGDVSAVNLGGLWPTVYLSQNGALWRLWGDNDGWHSEPTGVEVWGAISAIADDAGWPVVFNVRSGMLFRSWLDESGWHTESTGVGARGTISVVQTATGPNVFLVEDDVVYRIQTDGVSWSRTATDLDGGTSLAAVDLGGEAPLVVQAG